MLTASVLVLLNVRERRYGIAGKPDICVHHGFPLYAIGAVRYVDGDTGIHPDKAVALRDHFETGGILWSGMLFNIVFGIALLGGFAAISEYIIGLRSRAKT
jgi:hypothetical protein